MIFWKPSLRDIKIDKKNPRNCANMWNFYGFSRTNLNSTRLIYYDGTANSA